MSFVKYLNQVRPFLGIELHFKEYINKLSLIHISICCFPVEDLNFFIQYIIGKVPIFQKNLKNLKNNMLFCVLSQNLVVQSVTEAVIEKIVVV